MKNNIITEKSIHNESFDSVIEKLVQNQVNKILSAYMLRLDIAGSIANAKEVLTTNEVAELLGMNERVVREKINLGLIPAYKPSLSSKFLVLRSQLIKEIMCGQQYKTVTTMQKEINREFSNKKYV